MACDYPNDGKRTGADKIDKLTVVTHENFQAVIEAAKDPNSLLNKMSYIEIPEEDLSSKPVAVTSKPVLDIAFEKEQEKLTLFLTTGKNKKRRTTWMPRLPS